jgi:hypothetical protein
LLVALVIEFGEDLKDFGKFSEVLLGMSDGLGLDLDDGVIGLPVVLLDELVHVFSLCIDLLYRDFVQFLSVNE